MFTTNQLRRTAIVGALTCVLLVPAMAGVAAAASDESRLTAAYQQQRYYALQPGLDHPQGEYYASYGQPDPLTAPQAPAASDGTLWLSIGLALAGAVSAVMLAASQRRRVRIRRRVATT